MTHELKTWIKYYQRIFEGSKTFEVRKDDRDFQIGDFLTLKEYDNDKKEYTGRQQSIYVTYVLRGGIFGIEEGYCVMSIKLDLP